MVRAKNLQSRFKSQVKQEEFSKNVIKLSKVLHGEMEFLAGVRTFTHATQEEEDLNMDEVYDALDSFGAASKIAFAE